MIAITPHVMAYLAVAYVRVELAKRGIIAVDAPSFFDYDLITKGGQRIEVKCSKGRKDRTGNNYWPFTNTKEGAYTKGPLRHQRTDRKCDFFILVAFRESEIPSFFVVPKAIVGTKRCITVTKAGKYLQYLNAWGAVIEKELHLS